MLPKETRNYVPIILAVTIMAKNPEQYGLDEVVREDPVPSDTVKIDYPVDLRLAAECVGTTPDTAGSKSKPVALDYACHRRTIRTPLAGRHCRELP